MPAGELGEQGVADAYVIDSPEFTAYAPVAWARALAGLAADIPATAVIAVGSDRGSELMAHLAAITGLPMAANCVSAAWAAGGECRLVRQRWAGSLLEDATLDADLALLTVATDAVAAPALGGTAPEAPVTTSVHVVKPVSDDGDLVVRATESATRSTGISLATARVVVGGGRGVGG